MGKIDDINIDDIMNNWTKSNLKDIIMQGVIIHTMLEEQENKKPLTRSVLIEKVSNSYGWFLTEELFSPPNFGSNIADIVGIHWDKFNF